MKKSYSITLFNMFVINPIDIGYEVRRWKSDGTECPRIAVRKDISAAKAYCNRRLRWELWKRPFWFSDDERARLSSELNGVES